MFAALFSLLVSFLAPFGHAAPAEAYGGILTVKPQPAEAYGGILTVKPQPAEAYGGLLGVKKA